MSAVCYGGANSEDRPPKKFLGLLQHLMDIGFDLNTPTAPSTSRRYRPSRLLYIACWQASCESVECLLQHDTVIKGSRAMRSARCNGRIDVLEALLRHGGDANEVTEEEDIGGPSGSPLHAAAAAGRDDVVRFLLAHGADTTVENSEGITAKEMLEKNGMI